MDKTILLVFKIISFILIGLAVVFQLVVLFKGEDGLIGTSIIDNFMRTSYVALGIAAFLAILFPIIFIIQNPKSLIKMIIGIVVLLGLGFICYSIAGNSFSDLALEGMKATAHTSKVVGAALIFTYIIGGIAVLSIIFSGIAGIFK